jgi:hypothetical protein
VISSAYNSVGLKRVGKITSFSFAPKAFLINQSEKKIPLMRSPSRIPKTSFIQSSSEGMTAIQIPMATNRDRRLKRENIEMRGKK